MISGSTVTQLRDSIYLVDVVARAESGERASVEALRNLQITTPTGASVPLRELARFEYDLDEGYVWRRGRLPTITVQAEPLPGLEPSFVHEQIAGALDDLRTSMPAGSLLETGGTVEKSAESNAALLAQVPLMIALMLTVLMLQLGSFRRMALVVSVAPLGLIGVAAALLTTGTPTGESHLDFEGAAAPPSGRRSGLGGRLVPHPIPVCSPSLDKRRMRRSPATCSADRQSRASGRLRALL